MFQPALTSLIAATDSRLQSFSGGFRKNRAQFDSSDIVLLIAVLTVVSGLLWLFARWSERRVRRDSSLGLFWTLAKTHGVAWNDRWLLLKVARAKGLSEPALLFLDPRFTSPQVLTHLASRQAARIKTLRRRFFFGVDRIADEVPDAVLPETSHYPERPLPADVVTAGSANCVPPVTPGGNLAEILGAIRALKLQEQLVQRPEPDDAQSEDQESSSRTTPTAEFPPPDAPVLNLYPWLGNDWEITNADEQV